MFAFLHSQTSISTRALQMAFAEFVSIALRALVACVFAGTESITYK